MAINGQWNYNRVVTERCLATRAQTRGAASLVTRARNGLLI